MGAFWFFWLTAVRKSALVNGVLSQTVAGVVRQTLRTIEIVCYLSPYFYVFLREG
ncbi:hypothetical protein [Streptomyces lunaelactis]|uniref:hypothetical protein n=1 Tax=Streptomyces lunaelactis TaxID=1535768 RepID=UPI001584A408|nr:hypothetical protein [Streptomyces lunaelactis]NUK16287.1 hypothetical protein [Streptomyces lunaelactis]